MHSMELEEVGGRFTRDVMKSDILLHPSRSKYLRPPDVLNREPWKPIFPDIVRILKNMNQIQPIFFSHQKTSHNTGLVCHVEE